MSKGYWAVGEFVIAEKIKQTQQTSPGGILLAGKATPTARARIVDFDEGVSVSVSDRTGEALRMLEGKQGTEMVYLEQHAIPIEDDIIAVPAAAIVALVSKG